MDGNNLWLLDVLKTAFTYASYGTYVFFGSMAVMRIVKFKKEYKDSVEQEQLFAGRD